MLTKKGLAFLLSLAILLGMLPSQIAASGTTPAIIYENDFSNGQEAEATQIFGNDVLVFTPNFSDPSGVSGSWETIFQKELGATYNEKIYSGATLNFDLILPADAEYGGLLKAQAVTKMGDGWTWIQSSTIPEFKSDDFSDIENGYKRALVSIPFGTEIEENQGLKALIPCLAASYCDYTGEIYLDNVRLINGSPMQNQQTIFTHDFSNDAEALDFGDFYAVKFSVQGDISNNWQSIFQYGISADYSDKIYSGAILSFDLILPIDAAYTGLLKAQAVTKMGESWTWTQSSSILELKSDDFSDLGNGYKHAAVSIPFGTEIEAEQGLKEVIPGLAASNCDYIGYIYLANVKLINGTSSGNDPLEEVDPIRFTFDDASSLMNWTDGGNWDYDGGLTLSHTPEIGEGALSVTLDYSKNSSSSWSEAKIKYDFPQTIDLKGYTKFTCDVIYDPSKMSGGSFKLKLNAGKIDADSVVEKETDYSNGLKKATVTITFGSSENAVANFIVGIVGSNADYKGEIYLDNMTFDQLSQSDSPYVDASKTIEMQIPVSVSTSSITANNTHQNTLSQVSLVDDRAVANAFKLYAYLDAIGKTDSVLFGHQNDIHHKTGNKGLSYSDTLDATGSIAAVVGIDTLSLTGNELGTWDMTQQERITACADMTKEAVSGGAIITLSAHMPNFEIIHNRVKNHVPGSSSQNSVGILSDSSYNFSGYTPGTLSGDIVKRIMPGQDLNYLYTAYLDMIADYAKVLEQDNIPVLFRPFHENTGSWFWWGAAFCDKEAYKNLFRYTVEYLRDEKDVHNFLYVYSPSGDAENTAEFELRYPGDDYVDMVGFDMYHQYPAVGDDFIKQLKSQLSIVETFAKNHNKLFAVTETGVANGKNALLLKDNPRKDWYIEVLDAISPSTASYFLLWANFGLDSGYYTPFVTSKSDAKITGHEMLDNFIDFYNDGRSVFANETGNYQNLNVTAAVHNNLTGYITNPVSGSSIEKGIILEARVRNAGAHANVSFAAKNKAGDIIKTCTAVLNSKGQYTGSFTDEEISALGQTVGTISLMINGTSYNTISAKFNLTDVAKDPALIDDFEGYYGENSLLNSSWSTGKGTGCILKASLSSNAYEGDQSMEFKYSLVSGGYAGLTTSLKNPDWSQTNALQLWTIPDGKKQKVVVQLTSAGNVFEAYLNEYAAYNDTTSPVLVIIPFTRFVGRDNKNAVFDKNAVESFGLWCNAIVSKGESQESFYIDSVLYYDSIKAVKTDIIDVTFKPAAKPVSGGNGGSDTPGGSGSFGGSSGSGGARTTHSLANTEVQTTLKVNNNAQLLEERKINISLSTPSISSANAINAVVSQNSRLTALDSSLLFDLKFTNKDGKAEAPSAPVKVVFNLGGLKADKPLTLVHFAQKADNTIVAVLLGGDYDKEHNTFTAYVPASGNYAIMYAADMVQIKLSIGNPSAVINGQTRTNDAAPFIAEDSTVVPIRFIAEYLGSKVKWDHKTQQVMITHNNKTLFLDSNKSLADGGLILKGQRSFVPLRYISEQFGAYVIWDEKQRSIYIVK